MKNEQKKKIAKRIADDLGIGDENGMYNTCNGYLSAIEFFDMLDDLIHGREPEF